MSDAEAADPFTLATGATLAAIGGLHVAWGQGSTWPYPDAATLADQVVGHRATPSPAACNTVAGLLAAAALLVVTPPSVAPRLHQAGRVGVATVLGVRAALGFAGRTDLVSPGSASPTFRRNDRRRFSPLCAALAVGAGRAAWQQRRVSVASATHSKLRA
jgi:hypothetical protein